MRMSLADITERAQVAESAGFAGIALMDHLAPPMAEHHEMVDAMVAATWLAANTSFTISHLVLCDGFRHPAVLARQAASIANASGGRFELGIGWGSVDAEFASFGVDDPGPPARVRRLAETLEVLPKLWSGEPVDFHGEFHQLVAAQQRPVPDQRIPVVIGGAGPKTMALVAEHADWWNCPMYALGRLDELRNAAGSAKVSVQQMVTYHHDGADREDVSAKAAQRFGWAGRHARVEGDGSELRDHFAAQRSAGVERVYVWLTDFAKPATIEGFAASVIG